MAHAEAMEERRVVILNWYGTYGYGVEHLGESVEIRLADLPGGITIKEGEEIRIRIRPAVRSECAWWTTAPLPAPPGAAALDA